MPRLYVYWQATATLCFGQAIAAAKRGTLVAGDSIGTTLLPV
jgi:hypothetical protein